MKKKKKESKYILNQRKPRYARSKRHDKPPLAGEEILENTRTKKGWPITQRMGRIT